MHGQLPRPEGRSLKPQGSAHHIREGQGVAQRASDVLSIPLCYSCHKGKNVIHGDRTMLRIYKVDELDLLELTLERILHD
jgi:hypothetical protein